MKQLYLECGKIINVHGFSGVVKCECWTDSPAVFADYPVFYLQSGETYTPYRRESASVFKQFVLLKLEGVDSEASANALRNRTLFVSRNDLHLPAGKHLVADLVGLPVFDEATGNAVGTLSDISTIGSAEYYVVKTETGEHMVPAVPAFLSRVDEEEGIFLHVIPGLFGGEEEP